MKLECATALLLLLVVMAPQYSLCQTEEPVRIENERHYFAFTVRENSVVTYETEGEGFSAIYNSSGGGKGTHPDYGLIVYGTQFHRFSSVEAGAAGIDPAVETDTTPAFFTDQSSWQQAFSAQMKIHGREQAGTAKVTLGDGTTLEVPYFSWSVVSGIHRAHALTYAVIHNQSFIHVQVESSTELSEADVSWLISNLELLDPDRQDT